MTLNDKFKAEKWVLKYIRKKKKLPLCSECELNEFNCCGGISYFCKGK